MPSLLHQRLLTEATRFGTAEVLRQMPAVYTPELEKAIRQGIRQAVQYYADGLDSLSQRQPPFDRNPKIQE